MLDEINAFKSDSSPLKEKYLNYIQDKSIALEERWKAFCEAPADWKNTDGYIVHFAVEKALKENGGEISWYDDFYIEKNETVHLINVIERLEDEIESFEELGWNSDLIKQFKEEILEKNLASFDYDW